MFEYSGITKTSTTSFSVSPAKGWIIDNTSNPISPTVTYVSYSGGSGLDSPYRTSATITYILLTSGGTLTYQPTPPTPQQRRQNIYLGKIGHPDKSTYSIAFEVADFEFSPLSQLRDMFTPIPLINDGVTISANSGLTITNSVGNLYGIGINSSTSKLSPNIRTINKQLPLTFQYRTQTGGTTTNTTLIDPLNYDNNGVITAIGSPAKQATNQRIFLLQDGSFRLQYGQTIHTDLTTAISSISTETFTTFPNYKENGILIGILSLRSDTTNLTDITYAKFTSVSKFGDLGSASGSGGGTTTLQQAYDNSTTPEILTNSTLSGLSIKRGSASDSDRLIEFLNGNGDTKAYIDANGLGYFSTLQVTGLTNNTDTNILTIDNTGVLHYRDINSLKDIYLTGGTFTQSTGLLTLNNNSGNTINVSGGWNYFNQLTQTGNSITLTSNTGTTSTYTPNAATGGTYSNGTITLVGSGTLGTITGLVNINGTGFVKASGTTISYDNSSYLTAAVTSLNNLTGTTQTFTTGNTGTNFTITSSGSTHTFNIPDASNTARGFINTGSQTIAGTKTFTNNVTLNNGVTVVPLTGSGINNVGIIVSGSNTNGGISYVDFLGVTNTSSGATNINKWFRLNNTGGFEIINSNYSANLFTLTDTGVLTTSGSINGATPTEMSYLNGATSNIQTQINNKTDVNYKIRQALGSQILYTSYGRNVDQVTTLNALATGTMRIVPIWIDSTTTLTGFKWFQVAQGNYTGNNYNGGVLMDYAGGTMTVRASSTNDTEIWKSGANAIGSKAFSSTYIAAPGLYFFGFIYSSSAQTTAPSFGSFASGQGSQVSIADFTNNAKMTGVVNSVTALPTTVAMTSVVAATTQFFIGLY